MTTETLQWIIWGFGILSGSFPIIYGWNKWAGWLVSIAVMFFCTILALRPMADLLRGLHIGI